MNDPILPIDYRRLGERLRRLRSARDLSVRGLAAMAEVDATWLSRVERGGYTSPDPRVLAKVAALLEVDMADLFLTAGYSSGRGLPGLAPYLRAKYDLSDEAVEQLSSYFEFVREKDQPSPGGSDASNHHNT